MSDLLRVAMETCPAPPVSWDRAKGARNGEVEELRKQAVTNRPDSVNVVLVKTPRNFASPDRPSSEVVWVSVPFKHQDVTVLQFEPRRLRWRDLDFRDFVQIQVAVLNVRDSAGRAVAPAPQLARSHHQELCLH